MGASAIDGTIGIILGAGFIGEGVTGKPRSARPECGACSALPFRHPPSGWLPPLRAKAAELPSARHWNPRARAHARRSIALGTDRAASTTEGSRILLRGDPAGRTRVSVLCRRAVLTFYASAQDQARGA